MSKGDADADLGMTTNHDPVYLSCPPCVNKLDRCIQKYALCEHTINLNIESLVYVTFFLTRWLKDELIVTSNICI